jgi:hypothetical protein
MATEERTPARRSLFLRWVHGLFAVFLGLTAYQCLEGYLHGAPSPTAGRGTRWSRDLVVPLYTNPGEALFLAIAFGLVALVFAYFALRPPWRMDEASSRVVVDFVCPICGGRFGEQDGGRCEQCERVVCRADLAMPLGTPWPICRTCWRDEENRGAS